MKKGAPVFLAIFLTAFPYMAKAEGFDGWIVAPSLSGTFENSNQIDGLEVLCGIGLNVSLLFDRKYADEVEAFIMIEPEVSAEYAFFSNLLRIRTGAHFGRFHASLGSFGYYAGLSGSFIKDFANDATAFGISPEIGADIFMLRTGGRFQVQYDFYTDKRYNRFVFTMSITAMIAVDGGW